MEQSTISERPKASDYQAPATQREQAQFNPDRHVDQCFFCGRGLTQSAVDKGWWVHLGTDGTMLTQDDLAAEADPDLSQGCFPVGSECAKRITRPYKFRLELP